MAIVAMVNSTSLQEVDGNNSLFDACPERTNGNTTSKHKVQSFPANPETEGTSLNRPDTAEFKLAAVKCIELGFKMLSTPSSNQFN